MDNRIKELTDMFDCVEHSTCAYLEFEEGTQIPHREIACAADTEKEASNLLFLHIAHAVGSILGFCEFDSKIGLPKTDSLKNYKFVWRIKPDYVYSEKKVHSYYCRFTVYHKSLVSIDL